MLSVVWQESNQYNVHNERSDFIEGGPRWVMTKIQYIVTRAKKCTQLGEAVTKKLPNELSGKENQNLLWTTPYMRISHTPQNN